MFYNLSEYPKLLFLFDLLRPYDLPENVLNEIKKHQRKYLWVGKHHYYNINTDIAKSMYQSIYKYFSDKNAKYAISCI